MYLLITLLFTITNANALTSIRECTGTGTRTQTACDRQTDRQSHNLLFHRRNFFHSSAFAFAFTNVFLLDNANANSMSTNTNTYVSSKQGKGEFSYYTFEPPYGFNKGNKPLKTHLDEVNFYTKDGERGYQYGITVDPVRIQSLKEFGSPAQVAARVVTAEISRDGIADVTLVKDAVEDERTGCYAIDYVSAGGKRAGVKHFMTRICVLDQKLYVLTAQCKEDEIKDREAEMLKAVQSFQVITGSMSSEVN